MILSTMAFLQRFHQEFTWGEKIFIPAGFTVSGISLVNVQTALGCVLALLMIAIAIPKAISAWKKPQNDESKDDKD